MFHMLYNLFLKSAECLRQLLICAISRGEELPQILTYRWVGTHSYKTEPQVLLWFYNKTNNNKKSHIKTVLQLGR